jgi:hypothetical protein
MSTPLAFKLRPRQKCPPQLRPDRRQRGIALPAMVFMVVMVGLLLSAGLQLLTQSQHSQTLQLQTARALAGAKSGAEWGLWQVSDSQGAPGLPADTLPPCFATQTLALPAPLQDLTVQVSCVRVPDTGAVDEGGLKLASYRIIAETSSGSPSGNSHVRRQFDVRHTACKNPGGTGPAFGC